MQTNVLYPTHHSTGIWIFSLCVEWAAPERWLFCKKEQAIRHSTHHKQGGAAANSMENRSVPPVWVCLRFCSRSKKPHPFGWGRLDPCTGYGAYALDAETLPHLWLKCASRMGVGSKFFSSDECRILRSSRGRGCLRGKPLRVSLRFSIKVAAGGRFAAQIENAPKRNTTRVGGVSFCRVLMKRMRNFYLMWYLKCEKQLLFHGKHFAIRHYLISVLLK